jgi:hypothetical protein
MPLEIRKDIELSEGEFAMLRGTELCATMLANKYRFTDGKLADIIRSNANYTFHIMRSHYPRNDYIVYFSNLTDLHNLLNVDSVETVKQIETVIS